MKIGVVGNGMIVGMFLHDVALVNHTEVVSLCVRPHSLEKGKKIAEEGPCVIVGRCADYALEELDNVVSVFVHAPLEKRAARVAEYENIDMAAAKKMALQNDKKRASYYN